MGEVDLLSEAADLFCVGVVATVLMRWVTPIAVSDDDRAFSLSGPVGVPS
jgi:hypothetical protein